MITFIDINNFNENHLEFQLVTTDHLSESIWFRDEQDFKVGMNYIAIISLATGINVLAFILMSNHVHLVLQCSKEEADAFINANTSTNATGRLSSSEEILSKSTQSAPTMSPWREPSHIP